MILALGVRPDTTLARMAGLEIGELGGIRVDDQMRTSDPDIFAVGDAVEVRDFVTGHWSLIALAGPANRQGRIAADVIAGRDSRFRGTQGTAIVGLFGSAVAWTGANEKTLRGSPTTDFEKVYLYPNSHAGYYPGATPIAMKVLFRKSDGRVLGAQAVGQDGVDKRISELAMAIQLGATVYDLEEVRALLLAAVREREGPDQLRRDGRRRSASRRHAAQPLGRRRRTASSSTYASRSSSPSSMSRKRSTSRWVSCGRVSTSCPATGRSASSAAPASAPTTPRGSCFSTGSTPASSGGMLSHAISSPVREAHSFAIT